MARFTLAMPVEVERRMGLESLPEEAARVLKRVDERNLGSLVARGRGHSPSTPSIAETATVLACAGWQRRDGTRYLVWGQGTAVNMYPGALNLYVDGDYT